MTDSNEETELSMFGEGFSSGLSFTWLNPGPIEAGESMAPVRLTSEAAKNFAALHLALGDISFALECLKAADSIGIPNDNNLQSKSLIFSGVVAYARSFKTGVRAMTLNKNELIREGASFDEEIHDYLIFLRDKHIAHSVNDMEDCEAVAIVIGSINGPWRDGSAVGVVLKQSIGISRSLLQRALVHISALQSFLESGMMDKRQALHKEFLLELKESKEIELAPIMKLSDRSKIGERRK